MNVARLRVLLVAALTVLLTQPPAAVALDPNMCDDPGKSPDLLIGDIWNAQRFGTANGITSYGLGPDACNVGTCRLNWIASTPNHPVISQNMFRLKDGRMEQIGLSWLKHGFGADQNNTCSNACIPSDGAHLGINCSDAYSASQNGQQSNMGPRSDVNAYTGAFIYPSSHQSETGNVLFKRLQVHNFDLDPLQNPGAHYFGEIQYITADDALAGNGENNASYRPLIVSGSNGTYPIALDGETHRGEPAIKAWRESDPSVVETYARSTDDGLFILAAKVTSLGGGLWHYEYAIQNLNNHTGAILFKVPLPPGAVASHPGFHDVDYHSGETYDLTDWPVTIGGTPNSVTWTAVPMGGNTNALRWGTLYNFRFDADRAPGTHDISLGMMHPVIPLEEELAAGPQVAISTLTPSDCDFNGLCGPGETCANCPADCAGQGGGGGCCGDSVCQAGETAATCNADCAAPLAAEVNCGDNRDDDRDGLVDCLDPDCCTSAECDSFDLDGDSYGSCDCDDSNGGIWASPDEVSNLMLVNPPGGGATILSWFSVGGATSSQYEILRSQDPSDFVSGATCLSFAEPILASSSDPTIPPPGGTLNYLVRARNSCPNGVGPLGYDSSGHPRSGRSCP